ncbi:hypothetical protein [Methylomonas sp. MgM2]
MTNSNLLPFELSADGLTSWLDALGELPQLQAAHQMSQLLKQLKDEEQASELLPILISATPLTLHFSTSIAVAASGQLAPGKSRKAAKLSMQLLRQLSLLFSQLVEDPTLMESERQTAIYYALQCIGYCMRCYSSFYEEPSATLWKISALLYSLAAAQNALQTSQPTKLTEFKQQPTIEAVIKRNLLFSISSPTLLAPSEINEVFQFATEYADRLTISPAPDTLDFGFYWDLNDELPPCPTHKSRRALPNGFLAVDAQDIGLALQTDDSVANLDRNTQTRLALHLLGYQPIFDSIIPGQTLRAKFLFGFSTASNFLQEINKLQKIRQLSGQGKSASPAKLNLALIPLEHEKDSFEKMNQILSKTNSISKSGNVLTISHSSYLIAEGRAFDCSTGDVAMSYRDREPATFAIIRQQNALSISNVTHILMEKITGVYSVYSFKSANGNQTAIVVDEDSDKRQVFLPPGKYKVDSNIPLTTEQSLHLTACLESNAFFARFRFNFDS